MKRRRQAAILDLVDRVALSSQEDLRRRLRDLGFSVTQATLSRDLRDLGLVKASADGSFIFFYSGGHAYCTIISAALENSSAGRIS